MLSNIKYTLTLEIGEYSSFETFDPVKDAG